MQQLAAIDRYILISKKWLWCRVGLAGCLLHHHPFLLVVFNALMNFSWCNQIYANTPPSIKLTRGGAVSSSCSLNATQPATTTATSALNNRRRRWKSKFVVSSHRRRSFCYYQHYYINLFQTITSSSSSSSSSRTHRSRFTRKKEQKGARNDQLW